MVNVFKKDYIFIEPHPDDMILSAGELFLRQKPQKVITVFSSIKNDDEGTKNLCKEYGIKEYNFLKFPDIDIHMRKIQFNPSNLLLELDKNIDQDTILVCPIGFGHMAHTFLRNLIIQNFLKTHRILFVRDFPHSYKKSGKFWNVIYMFNHLFSIDDGFEMKIEIFKKFYKSQSALLWYDKKYFEAKPSEEYYEYKQNKNWWERK